MSEQTPQQLFEDEVKTRIKYYTEEHRMTISESICVLLAISLELAGAINDGDEGEDDEDEHFLEPF